MRLMLVKQKPSASLLLIVNILQRTKSLHKEAGVYSHLEAEFLNTSISLLAVVYTSLILGHVGGGVYSAGCGHTTFYRWYHVAV